MVVLGFLNHQQHVKEIGVFSVLDISFCKIDACLPGNTQFVVGKLDNIIETT